MRDSQLPELMRGADEESVELVLRSFDVRQTGWSLLPVTPALGGKRAPWRSWAGGYTTLRKAAAQQAGDEEGEAAHGGLPEALRGWSNLLPAGTLIRSRRVELPSLRRGELPAPSASSSSP